MSEENGNGGVVVMNPPVNGFSLTDLSTDAAMDAAVKHFENALKFKDRALALAVRTARAGAIVDMAGKPYFSESECERILSLLGGGSVQILSVTREDGADGNYGIQVMARVAHPTLGTFDGLGFASTSDQFLGTAHGKRDVEDVSSHNLRQHAFTRAKGSAIRKMLSLTSMTWQELAAMGFERGKGGTVNYKKDETKAADKTTKAPARKPAPKPPEVPADVLALRKTIEDAVSSDSVSMQEIAELKKEFGFGEDERVMESVDVAKLTALAAYCSNKTKGGAQ